MLENIKGIVRWEIKMYLIIRIEKDEGDHHEIVRGPTDNEG